MCEHHRFGTGSMILGMSASKCEPLKCAYRLQYSFLVAFRHPSTQNKRNIFKIKMDNDSFINHLHGMTPR